MVHRTKKLSIVLILILVALTFSACGGKSEKPEPTAAPQSQSEAPAVAEVAAAPAGVGGEHGPGGDTPPEDEGEPMENGGVEGAEKLTIMATEMAFEPNMIELVAGKPVNLTLVNDGVVDHDWDLEEAGLNLRAGAGAQVTQAVVVDEPGTYEVVCTEPGHAEAGMTMTVEVSPSGDHTPSIEHGVQQP